jgi:hypothetical protein
MALLDPDPSAGNEAVSVLVLFAFAAADVFIYKCLLGSKCQMIV